jgi:hypothetical protein
MKQITRYIAEDLTEFDAEALLKLGKAYSEKVKQ